MLFSDFNRLNMAVNKSGDTDGSTTSRPPRGSSSSTTSRPPRGSSDSTTSRPPRGSSDSTTSRPPRGSSDSTTSRPPRGASSSTTSRPPRGSSDTATSRPPRGSSDSTTSRPPRGSDDNTSTASRPPRGARGSGGAAGKKANKEINIDKLVAGLCTRDPFLGTLAAELEISADPGCGTAYTNGEKVCFDPDFFKDLTFEEQMGVIAHEFSHVALMHVYRARQLNVDPELWNIAADMVINDALQSQPSAFKLPACGIVDIPEKYRGLSTEDIYEKLLDDPPPFLHGDDQDDQEDQERSGSNGGNSGNSKKDQKSNSSDNQNSSSGGGDEQENDEDSSSSGKNKKGNKKGNKNSRIKGTAPTGTDSNGDPLSGKARVDADDLHIYDGDENKKGSEEGDSGVPEFNSRNNSVQGGGGSSGGYNPRDLDKAQEVEAKIGKVQSGVPDKVAQAIYQAGIAKQATSSSGNGSFGNGGDDASRILDKLLKVKTPWHKLLKNYCLEYEKSDTSLMNPNRRYISRGIYLPGNSVNYDDPVMEKINIYIDASGSIGDTELTNFLAQIAKLYKDLHVDTAIIQSFSIGLANKVKCKNVKQIKNYTPASAGGTEIESVIQDINKTDALVHVVFTDGEYDQRPIRGLKRSKRVFWVIYGNPGYVPSRGKCVHVDLKELSK